MKKPLKIREMSALGEVMESFLTRKKELQAMQSDSESDKKYTRAPLQVCEPVAIRKVVELLGSQTKAGEALGISPSHISACLTAGEVRISYELAAKAKLHEMGVQSEQATTTYIVKVPKDQAEVFKTFVRGMGIKVMSV